MAGLLAVTGCGSGGSPEAAGPDPTTSSQPSTAAPATAAGSGSTPTEASIQWREVAEWTHSWDLADPEVVTYEHPGNDFLAPATRVAEVPDRGSDPRPLRRDEGAWGAVYSGPAVPGPLWIPSSESFEGRPSFLGDDAGPSGAIDTLLTPNEDPRDPAKWFEGGAGIAPPYWGVVLGRASGAIIDSFNGDIGTGPTINGGFPREDEPKRWSIATFGPPPFPWPSTDVEIDPDQTVLIMFHISGDGEDSFLEVNWRDPSGVLRRERVTSLVRPWPYRDLFFGYAKPDPTESAEVTAAGIGIGVPTPEDLDAVREWAYRFIPPTPP